MKRIRIVTNRWMLCGLLGLIAPGCGSDDAVPRRVVDQEPVTHFEGAMAAEAGGGVPLLGAGGMGDRLLPQERSAEQTAVDALSRIGSPSVPALVTVLRDPDPELRKDAAKALARMGSEASQAVPELIVALGDKDADVRKFATRALGEIGPGAGDAVPALIKQLRQSAQQAEQQAEQAAKANKPLTSSPFGPKNTATPAK